MGKSNRNQGFGDDKPIRDEEAFIADSSAASAGGEKFVDIKAQIEKKISELENQLDSEQGALKDLSETLSKKFADDFSKLNGELQTLMINVRELNLGNEADEIKKEIDEFTGQLEDLRSRILGLSNDISAAVGEAEPGTAPEQADIVPGKTETIPPEPAVETTPKKQPKEVGPPPVVKQEKSSKEPRTKKKGTEVRETAAAGKFVIEGGVLRAPDFSIDLPPAVKSGNADITEEKDGWYFIKSKVGDKRSVRVRLGDEGRTVQIYTPVSHGTYLPDAAAQELNKTFGEFRQAPAKGKEAAKPEKIVIPKQEKTEKPPEPVKADAQPKGTETPRVIKKEQEPSKPAETVEKPEVKEPIEISQDKLQKIVGYLEDVVSDGNADSNYPKWIANLRTRLPAEPDESDEMKSRRILVDEILFQDNLRAVTEHLDLMHNQKQADTMITLKKGEEKAKWEKRKAVLDDLYGGATAPKPKEKLPVEKKPVDEAAPVTSAEQQPREEIAIKPEEEPAVTIFETEEQKSEADQVISELVADFHKEEARVEAENAVLAEGVEIDMSGLEAESAADIQAHNERINELTIKLIEARNKLTEAFINKEKASGVIGRFKKMFRKEEAKNAENAAFETAWNEYAGVQKELIEANQAQAEQLRSFLNDQSGMLQEKIGEYYKGKENVVGKVWRRLGEMNLYNYLEHKGKEVGRKDDEGETIGMWDRFWANRAEELKGSNMLYKIGAKALSVRLGLSMGLLGAGVLGFTGAAEARGLMVGIGTAFGTRHAEDAIQNKVQRWLGNRGDFYGTSDEAEAALRDKYHLATVASGEIPDDLEDNKTEKRRKKMENELVSVEGSMVEFDLLPIEERMAKIQEKIASVEAFSYVNGVDLSKDANYRRLIAARDRATHEYLSVKAIEAGDERPIVRPDDMKDALAFLENRKNELLRTAEKISTEKKMRWGKRLVSVAAGAVAGTFAYFATLSRAELFAGHKPPVAAFEAAPAAGTAPAEMAAPEEMIPGQPGMVVEDEIIRAASPEELAKMTRFFDAAGDNQNAIQEFQQHIQSGHSPEDISNSLLVHKGDGIERVLQRQLLFDPEAHGFKGNINDMAEVRKWAGHEASVIAEKQGLSDKYFIYDAKNPQYLVLRKDGNIDIVGQGKLHHVSEIEAAKAREAAEQAADTMKTPEGEVMPVKEVIDIKTGQPDIFTDSEQAQYQLFMNRGDSDEAMNLMIKCQARGPIFEMPDGTEIHRADIGEWEGGAPAIKTLSGSTIETDYLGTAEKPHHYAFVEESDSRQETEQQWRNETLNKLNATEEGTPAHEAVQQEIHDRFNLKEIDKIQDLREGLSQTHPDSVEHGAIVNALKDKIGEFKMRTGQDPDTVFGKEFVEEMNSTPEYKGPAAHIAEQIPAAEKMADAQFDQWQAVQAREATDYLRSLKGTDGYEAYRTDLISKGYHITGDIVTSPEAGHVPAPEPLEVQKPLSQMAPEEMFEAADKEMAKISEGFKGFYDTDNLMDNRLDSLKGVLKPGETFEQNTIKYTLSGDKIIYKVGNISGVVDNAEKANLLSDMTNLVKEKSAEIALTDGPARQEMQRIVSELDKLNKKVI